MIRITALAGVAALAFTSLASAQPQGPRPGAGFAGADYGAALPTRAYLVTAARSDEFEIAEARMALRRTSDPHIRQFAQMMIQDHTQSTDMIHAALSHSGRPIPPAPALGPEQDQMLAALRASGPAFDRVYIDQQVQAHQKALRVHSGYAQGGEDPALRHTAGMIVPVVQHHLQAALAIQSHIG